MPAAAISLRLLLVEDNPDDEQIILTELRRGGFAVTCTRVEGRAAFVGALQAGPWDLIISDYNLPSFTGFESLALCREAGLEVPFILVSGTIGEDVAVEAMRRGAQDYLLKDQLKRLVPAVHRELREAGIRRERRLAKAALSESESRFSTIFNHSSVAIVITTLADGTIVDVNPAGCEVSGYSREALLGHRTIEFETWADLAERQRLVVDVVQAGRVCVHEQRMRTRDGRWLTFFTSFSRIELDGVAHLLVMLQDITDRKRAEEVLRESEERYRLLIENSDGLIVEMTRDGRILYASPNHTAVLGFTPAEIAGATAFAQVHPEDRAEVSEKLAGKNPGSPVAYRYRNKAGIWRWLESSGSAFFTSAGDERIVVISRDITEQLKAAQALRESEEKFATAFRASPGGMSISDYERRHFIDANDGYLQMCGYTREELIGRSPSELGLWVDQAERARFRATFAQDGFVRDLEVRYRRKNGSIFTCLISAQGVQLGGRKCMVLSLYDISQRKKTEEEKQQLENQLRHAQKMEAIGTLAGGIAHDFNNVLTGIYGNVQLAQLELPDGSPVTGLLANAMAACDRARDLVGQILTFSRRNDPKRAIEQLGPVVREALGLLRASLPSTIEIRSSFDPSCPPVLCDSTQIHQVVMNLGANAAHAMRERGGVLLVRVRSVVVDAALQLAHPALRLGPAVCLEVDDTGCGMDAATRERIFEPFFTTKPVGEGTGLGLAVVHGIVQSHEGAIGLESAPGAGTRFAIYFPVADVARLAGSEPSALVPRGRGQRVVLIDDEPMIATLGARMLSRIGYEPIAFTDSRVALEAFARAPQSCDLVITDLTMPHVTGADVVKQLLALRPDLPVIIATGRTRSPEMDLVRSLGVRHTVAKPFSLQTLAQTVADALQVAVEK